jgi:hypothetical protein
MAARGHKRSFRAAILDRTSGSPTVITEEVMVMVI